MLFYLAGYALMKLGAFIIVAQLGGTARASPGHRRSCRARAAPARVAAACFSLFLLSLLGLPITAGFLGKFYIFNAALESHLVWLAVLLALNSVIGAFYYLRVIVVMYMREPATGIAAEPVPWTLCVVLVDRRRGHGTSPVCSRPGSSISPQSRAEHPVGFPVEHASACLLCCRARRKNLTG